MEEVLDIQQQVPQQEDPPIKKLYKGLYADKKYTKSFDEFKKQYSTPEAIDKLYTGLREDGDYTKEKSDFHKQYFSDIAAPSKKKVGSVVFGETYSSPELDSETPSTGKIPEVVDYGNGELLPNNPVDLSKKAFEYSKKTKQVERTSMGGNPIVETVDDKDAQGISKKILDDLEKIHIGKDFISAVSDLPDESFNDPNTSKEALVDLYKNNKIKFHQVVNEQKNRLAIRKGAAEKTNSNNTGVDDIDPTQMGIHVGNQYLGTTEEQNPQTFGELENVIAKKQAIIDDSLPNQEEKDKAKQRLKETYSSYINPSDPDLMSEYEQSPLKNKVDPTQYAGLKTLQLFSPESYEQAVRVLNTDITKEYKISIPFENFQSPVAASPNFTTTDSTVSAKNKGVLTAETIDQQIGKETVLRQLTQLGRDNLVTQINSQQYDLEKAFNSTDNPEEKEAIKQQYVANQERLNEVKENASQDKVKFPLTSKMEFDNQVKELTQDAGMGAVEYGTNKFLHGVGNGTESLEDMAINLFGSDKDKALLGMKRLGEGKWFESKTYLPEEYKGTGSPVIMQASKTLKDAAKKIMGDKKLNELSDDQRKQLTNLVADNQDQIETVTNPDAGKSKNFFSKSTLYSNAGFMGDIGAFMYKLAGAKSLGLSGKTAELATLYNDGYSAAYNQAVAEGDSPSIANQKGLVHGGVMLLAGTVSSKFDAVKDILGTGKSKVSKEILGLGEAGWDAIVNKNKGTINRIASGVSDVAKSNAKMIGTYGVGVSIANDLADKGFFNKDISADQIAENVKHSAIDMAIGTVGLAGIGFISHVMKNPVTLKDKATIWEIGDNPEISKIRIDESVARNELTQAEGDAKKKVIDNINSLISKVPTENSKGKPLSDEKKINYLYNSILKEKGKEASKDLPGTQSEKAEMASMVADHANGIILENPTLDQLNKRAKSLEGKLMPKMDSDGKSIELTEKEKKNYEAELQAVNDAIKHKESFDNSVKLERRNLQEQKDTPEEVVPNEPLSDVSGEGSVGVGVEAKLEKPSAEQQLKDIEEGNMVTFEYKNESEVPEVFKDKISSKGEVNGKTYVKVTMAKSLADYHLKEQSLKETPKSETKPIQKEPAKEEPVSAVSSEKTDEQLIQEIKDKQKQREIDRQNEPALPVTENTDNNRKDWNDADYEQKIDKLKSDKEKDAEKIKGDKTVLSVDEQKELDENNKFYDDKIAETKKERAERLQAKNKENKPIQSETKANEVSITSKGEIPTTTTVDKVSGTAEEGTGGKPPTETEVNISVGDGKEQIGISHAEFDKVSKELGLNAPYEKEPQTLEQWHKEADERLAKGDMPDVIAKMEKGDMPSSAEQLMIAKYVAGLKYEYNKTGSDAVLKEFRRIKELSDKAAGAEWGRIGVARQQMIDVNPLEGGLLSATAAKMDANGGELTEKQKAEVEKQVDKYKKAAEEEKKLREEAEQKNEDLIAQMEIDRMSAENKRSSTKGVKPKDSKEKRQALKDKLKDQWQQFKDEGQKLGISSNNNSFIISTKMAKTIAEIAKSYVDDGVTKLSDVVSKVYDEIKGFIPNVTERDIRDVIAGKYNEKKETRNELQAKWYDIQREQKLLNELERVMSGKPKNEKQTIQKNKRLAELRDQIDKVKKEKGLDQYSDEQKLKNLKSSNDKAAERLKKRIADKDFAPEKPKSFIENFEFKRKYPKLYNDVINAIHRKDEAAHEFDIALNNDRMAKEGKAKKVFKFFGKIKNTFQSLVAGVDDSMAFVQLGWSLLVNPKTAVNFKKYTDKDGKVKFAVGGAIKEHALDAWSKSRFDRQMTALHNSPAWPLIQASELDVLEPQSLLAKQKEEMFQHNLANKVGIGTINLGKSLSLEGTKLEGLKRVNLGKFLEIWERAYTSLGNNVRVDLFLRQAKLLYENGMTIENNLQEFKDLAKGINNLTGRGTTHAKVAPIVPFVTPVIWSPKMIASSINLLGLSDITGKQAGFYSKMSPEARKYVVKQMATGIGIAASTMMAAAVGGATVHYDPRDPQFGEIEYDNGKKSFNVFLRYAGYIRLIAQLWPGFLGGGRKNASGQVVSPYDEGGKTVGSVIGSFFRGKTNPASGLAYDYFLNDKEGFFDRQPMTLKTSAEQMLMPMSLRQVRSQLEKDGTLALLNYTLPNFVGIPMKDRQEYVTQDLNVPEWKFLDDKGLRVTPHKKETLEPIDDNGKPIEVTESKYQDFLKKREDYIQEDIKKLMDGKGYVENGEGNWEGLKKSDVKDLTTDELKGWLMTKTTQANEKAMMDVFKGTQAPKNTGKRKIETE